MSQPLRPPTGPLAHQQGDPAYWMLEQGRKDPSKRSKTTVHDPDCYICKDPEFSLMSLPLCYPCPVPVDGSPCGRHVAADDTECGIDGHDAQEQYMKEKS